MYSVVLMAALSAGTASQDCCFTNSCNWCGSHNYSSCYGGCYGGCYGASYSGCSGFGYSGCYGGCYGSCYGASYSGCAGFGYSGCYGGSYGGSGCYGSSGCYGCSGCYGGMIVSPYTTPPMMPGTEMKKTESIPAPQPDKKETQAKVVIDVPATASLYIDGQLMPKKAGTRTFVTPTLQPGQTYYYDIKLVQVEDGREQVQTSRVLLRPGEVVAATFDRAATGITTVAAPKP